MQSSLPSTAYATIASRHSAAQRAKPRPSKLESATNGCDSADGTVTSASITQRYGRPLSCGHDCDASTHDDDRSPHTSLTATSGQAAQARGFLCFHGRHVAAHHQQAAIWQFDKQQTCKQLEDEDYHGLSASQLQGTFSASSVVVILILPKCKASGSLQKGDPWNLLLHELSCWLMSLCARLISVPGTLIACHISFRTLMIAFFSPALL